MIEPLVAAWLLVNTALAVSLGVAGYHLGRQVERHRARSSMLAALRRAGRLPTTEPGGVRTPATSRAGSGVRDLHTPRGR